MRAFKHLMLAGLLACVPLASFAQQPEGEPEVTIRQEEDRTVEEYRVNGFLYAIRSRPSMASPISWYAPMATRAISCAPTSRTC